MDPRTLMLELDAVLPPNRVLSVDIGHSFTFPIAHLRRSGPRSMVQPLDAGSIGLSLGCGIGAALARPEATVITIIGDAAFMMSVGDLETAVRYQIPLIVVVMNDEALGAEVHLGDLMGVPRSLCLIPTPSLAAVAESMGAEGFTIACSDDIASLACRLERPVERPLLLDCRINGDVRADWFDLILSMHTRE
jgi:thiamine pyrophosphate-dependent acetolactate synthase large subunit-like protein